MPTPQTYDVIVIGAGAAGLMAAGRAAEKGASTLLLEKMNRPARKLLITGKGRCNITTAKSKEEFIQNTKNGSFLRNSFSQFYTAETLALMEKYKLPILLERGERYFPASNKASDVVNVLIKWANENGVKILCQQKVEHLILEKGRVKGVWANKQKILAKNVIVATGGKSYPATGSTGDGYQMGKQASHSIISPKPALVPLESNSNLPKLWKKLTLKNVIVSLWADNRKEQEAFGELLFTDFGLAGASILNLSKKAVETLEQNKQVKIKVDLKPALDEKKLDARLLRELDKNGKTSVLTFFKSLIPLVMINGFANEIGIDIQKKCHQITKEERKKILFLLKNLTFHITKYRPFSEAIVTEGGIDTKEINPKTMESKKIKNLYFTGEVLDLDAPTGGYNLQIAFTTGWVAGNAICLSE